MIKKLSLAAIVAMSSITVANAADLSEAIKGVNASGYLRYRLTSNDKSTEADRINEHEYKAKLKLSAKTDENMKVTATFVAKNKYLDSEGAKQEALKFKESYLTYSKDALAINAGQFYIKTPLTSGGDDYGTAVVATYKVSDITAVAGFVPVSNLDGTALSNNVYTAGVIGKASMVNYTVFGYTVTDVYDSALFAEAKAEVAGLEITGQYASKAIKDGDTHSLMALGLSGKAGSISYSAAYIAMGTDGSDVSVGSDADAIITVGEEITSWGKADGSAFGAAVSTKVAGYDLGADFAMSTYGDTDETEFVLRASKKYNKNLKFKAYYSMLSEDTNGNDKTDNEFRFEAKYSF
jgi:hypothetical protein